MMFSYLALEDGAVSGHLDSMATNSTDPGSGQPIPKALMDAD